MEELIKQYGNVILFIGTFAEGETILVLAGFLAHQGYLQLPWVIFTAFLGTLTGDQLFYYLGYLKGLPLLKKFPRWQAKIGRVLALFTRYQTPIILGFRFLFGLRSVTPFVIGLSKIKPLRFLLLNAFGAAIWAFTVGLLGYSTGQILEWYVDKIRGYEMIAIGVTAAIGFLIWITRLSLRRGAREPGT